MSSAADTIATVVGATSVTATTISVMARYFIRSVVSEEMRKIRDYLDDKFSAHLRNDHGYGIHRRVMPSPRPSYKPEEE